MTFAGCVVSPGAHLEKTSHSLLLNKLSLPKPPKSRISTHIHNRLYDFHNSSIVLLLCLHRNLTFASGIHAAPLSRCLG